MLVIQPWNACIPDAKCKQIGNELQAFRKTKKAIPRQEGWLAVVERMRLELITSTLPVSRSSQMS